MEFEKEENRKRRRRRVFLTVFVKDFKHGANEVRIQGLPQTDVCGSSKFLLGDRLPGDGVHCHGNGEVLQRVEQLAKVIELLERDSLHGSGDGEAREEEGKGRHEEIE